VPHHVDRRSTRTDHRAGGSPWLAVLLADEGDVPPVGAPPPHVPPVDEAAPSALIPDLAAEDFDEGPIVTIAPMGLPNVAPPQKPRTSGQQEPQKPRNSAQKPRTSGQQQPQGGGGAGQHRSSKSQSGARAAGSHQSRPNGAGQHRSSKSQSGARAAGSRQSRPNGGGQKSSVPSTPGNQGGFGMKIVPRESLKSPPPANGPARGSVPIVKKTSAHENFRQPHNRPQKAKVAVSNWFGLGEDPYGTIPPPQKQRKPRNDPAIALNPAAAMAERAAEPKKKAKKEPKLVVGATAMQEYKKFIQKETDWNRANGNKGRFGLTIKTMPRSPKAATMKVSKESMVRAELLSLPVFTPIFINFITFVQFLVFMGMIFKALVDGDIAKWGLVAEGSTCAGDACPLSANSTLLNGSVQIEPVNPWLGPTSTFLIQFNSKYSPCMRDDAGIDRSLVAQRNIECCSNCAVTQPGSPYQVQCDAPAENDGTPAGYACCAMPSTSQVIAATSNDPQTLCQSFFPTSGQFNGTTMVTTTNGVNCLTSSLLYGMTSYPQCVENGGVWMRSGTTNLACPTTGVRITLRPCCIGHRSECELLTQTQCEFEAGLWHEDKQLCAETPCLAETCTTVTGVTETGQGKPNENEIETPDQWYRFIAPVFVHSGAIQVILVLYVQQELGCPIERTIGWLRMGLIYMISGIGGYVVSGVLDPYVVSCGANPAVFGLIGLMTVELLQSWSVVPNKWTHLFKLFGLILVGFVIGSFPFVDNMAQLGGFCFGLVSSVVFLPYVSFGKWHARARKILLFICVPLLLFMILVGIIMFYTVQVTDCPWCGDFNCWQWTSQISCDGD